MYTNDLHNAYQYETERRLDEMANAEASRLAKECRLAKQMARKAALKNGWIALLNTLHLHSSVAPRKGQLVPHHR